jgi:hypothetical protein
MKALVPSLLLLGAVATTSLSAADQASDKVLGFEFGVGYHLVDDSHYEGTDINFGLVIPVGQKFDVVVYHESGVYTGKQDGVNSTADTDANELRFRVAVWDGESQAVKLVLGLGYQNVNFDPNGADTSVSAIVADLGVNFTVIKTKSGPVKGEIALNAFYRHFRFADTDTDLDDDSKKLGGFIIGVNAGLYF